jgi:hypothetical protein
MKMNSIDEQCLVVIGSSGVVTTLQYRILLRFLTTNEAAGDNCCATKLVTECLRRVLFVLYCTYKNTCDEK